MNPSVSSPGMFGYLSVAQQLYPGPGLSEAGKRRWVNRRQYASFGTALRGRTRPDPDGNHHATLWVIGFGLPLVPLTRYRIREVDSDDLVFVPRFTDTITTAAGQAVRLKTTDLPLGETPLSLPEVLRSLGFWWLLVPILTMLPPLAVLSRADEVSEVVGLLPVMLFVILWPILTGYGLLVLTLWRVGAGRAARPASEQPPRVG